MKKQIINDIEQKMRSVLNNEQRKRLEEVLEYAFYGVEIIKNDNDAKQLCFGDFTYGLFVRTEDSHWDAGTIITSTDGIEKWSETKDYVIGDIVYDEETFSFEVNGKKSNVTLTDDLEYSDNRKGSLGN